MTYLIRNHRVQVVVDVDNDLGLLVLLGGGMLTPGCLSLPLGPSLLDNVVIRIVSVDLSSNLVEGFFEISLQYYFTVTLPLFARMNSLRLKCTRWDNNYLLHELLGQGIVQGHGFTIPELIQLHGRISQRHDVHGYTNEVVEGVLLSTTRSLLQFLCSLMVLRPLLEHRNLASDSRVDADHSFLLCVLKDV